MKTAENKGALSIYIFDAEFQFWLNQPSFFKLSIKEIV